MAQIFQPAARSNPNRFALLDDEPAAPKPAPVAEAPAPAAAPKQSYNDVDRAPRNNYEGGRGRGGRGRGGDRPYVPRGDGESNPHKREYDGHVSRADYVRGGGRGRGGRGGAKRDGAGRFNTGVANEVAPEQSTEDALNALPAADGESPAAAEAAPVEPEEVDTTITLMQFMALQKAKAQLEDDVARNLRRAGEDIVEEDFQNAKAIKKASNADDVLGASGKIEKSLSGGAGPKQLVEKKTAPIDVVFSAPAGGRGGRGGYGAPRGGSRGGRGGYGGPNPVNITDNKAFPTLGK